MKDKEKGDGGYGRWKKEMEDTGDRERRWGMREMEDAGDGKGDGGYRGWRKERISVEKMEGRER